MSVLSARALRGWIAGTAVLLLMLSPAGAEGPRLRVSDNQRFLIHDDGRPFFYLGDTAWELFHRLNREEADLYLRNRADKGFTVIQAVVLAELDGLHVPNPYGHTPLLDDDPTRPNPAYFEHVDWIVQRAGELGLMIGMLPTWGDKFNKKWGVGPEVFTPENARVYGEFLGKRYRDAPILWILGGDRPIESERHRRIIEAMAAGLAAGDDGAHLLTYHPMGGQSSADWFHDADWLGFHMIQSGHSARNLPNYDRIRRDYERKPTKPVLDGEPCYEDHPINWNGDNGWFDDHDVRKAAYWALFAGAFGHTYGCHDIWQMWQPGREPISAARTPWKQALDLPATYQVRHARNLLLSRPFLSRIPDQSLIVGDAGKGGDHVQATRDRDGSYAFVYVPSGRPVTIDLGKLSGNRVRARWFDPRDGSSRSIGEFDRAGQREFTPPKGGPDWVLVLDDASKGYPDPGQLP